MENKLKKLIRFNYIMAFLHGIQAVVMAILASDYSAPVTTSYLTLNESGEMLVPATSKLFDVEIAALMVAFLAICSIAHLFIATVYKEKYVSDLKKGINKVRWIEYSVSASLMIIGIAMLAGITDLSSLIMMFTLVAGMNLMGLVMEVVNQGKKRPSWLSYNVGVLLGIVPWIAYAIYIWGSSYYTVNGGPPTFVYFILFSIFLLFNCFAINMYLQYRRTGKWKDYLYGEKVYIILSLVAKSALAWQVFFGTLRGV